MTQRPDPDLKEFINAELLPRIETMKEVRGRRRRLFFVSALISTVVAVGVVGGYGMHTGVDEIAIWEFGIVLAAVIVYGAALHGVFHLVFVRGARREYVDAIVAPLVDRVRSGVDHRPDAAISKTSFEDSALAQLSVDGFESRDLFSARVDGGRIEFSELEVRSRVRKQGDKFAPKRTCFVLRGLFFSASVDAGAPGATTVVSPTLRRFSNADELPRIQVDDADIAPVVRPAEDWPHIDWTPELFDEPMGPVTIPDPEFGAAFDVYSTDIAGARAMFGPSVVERLKTVYEIWRSGVHRTAATEANGAGYFILLVRDGHVYLARPMPRKFVEIRAFSPRQQTEILLQFARDIRLGIELIEQISTAARSHRSARGAGRKSLTFGDGR